MLQHDSRSSKMEVDKLTEGKFFLSACWFPLSEQILRVDSKEKNHFVGERIKAHQTFSADSQFLNPRSVLDSES